MQWANGYISSVSSTVVPQLSGYLYEQETVRIIRRLSHRRAEGRVEGTWEGVFPLISSFLSRSTCRHSSSRTERHLDGGCRTVPEGSCGWRGTRGGEGRRGRCLLVFAASFFFFFVPSFRRNTINHFSRPRHPLSFYIPLQRSSTTILPSFPLVPLPDHDDDYRERAVPRVPREPRMSFPSFCVWKTPKTREKCIENQLIN